MAIVWKELSSSNEKHVINSISISNPDSTGAYSIIKIPAEVKLLKIGKVSFHGAGVGTVTFKGSKENAIVNITILEGAGSKSNYELSIDESIDKMLILRIYESGIESSIVLENVEFIF